MDSSAPSSSSEANSGPLSGGQIGVTLYSGSQPNGTGNVDLIWPDGSKQTANAAPSCTFTALTQSGSYRIQFHAQNAILPAFSLVSLSASAPIASVRLQVGGASLQVQPVAFQASSYAFSPAEFHYSVQVVQAPADAQDMLLDIDPATLPSGWSWHFDSAVVRGNISTNLVVNSALATTQTAAALKVRARVGVVERLSQALTLQKAWSLSWTSSLITSDAGWNPTKNSFYCSASYNVLISATGLPTGQSAYLRCVNCPGAMTGAQPGGLLLPLNKAVTVYFNDTVSSCVPNQMSVCLDAYCTPNQWL